MWCPNSLHSKCAVTEWLFVKLINRHGLLPDDLFGNIRRLFAVLTLRTLNTLSNKIVPVDR